MTREISSTVVSSGWNLISAEGCFPNTTNLFLYMNHLYKLVGLYLLEASESSDKAE